MTKDEEIKALTDKGHDLCYEYGNTLIELANTKGVLQDLVDLQNGPPLIQHKQEWELTMKIAREILKPTEGK